MTADPLICPHCRQPMPDRPAKIRGMGRKIFERVKSAGSEGLSSEAIFNALYAGDIHGGPSSGVGIVKTHISYLNKKLRATGLEIRNVDRGGRYSGHYVLAQTIVRDKLVLA